MTLSKTAVEIILNKAIELYDDGGDIHFDDIPDTNPESMVSTHNSAQETIEANGFYVKAWTWVSFNDMTQDEIKAILGKDYKAYEAHNK